MSLGGYVHYFGVVVDFFVVFCPTHFVATFNKLLQFERLADASRLSS